MGCVLSSLVAKFAFFPPTPPTYAVRQNDSGRQVAVPSVGPGGNSTPYEESSMDVWVLDTKSGNKVVAFYMRNPYARLTLLYSHGNAADLGQLYDLFTQLKVNLRVNLMGYDYSGYGASTGKPSESNTYADIEAVYQCLETEYGVSQEDLILYGQSVGSGPTLHLAAQLPRLRGVVLHSAILSGLRVVCHVKCMFCLDMYKNVNKIRKVKSPVLVIHGTDDDVVSWRHGNKLWKLSREPYDPLWIKGGGHCNLEIYPDYIRHLRRFVIEMENVTTSIRLKKVWPRIQNQATSSWYCCRVKFCRPSYPKCSAAPSCPKCFCQPKWPECLRPSCSCGSCCPKCLWGLKFPGCPTKCFYKPKWPEYLKFSCSCFSCGSCLWKLKCPKCCSKCFCELNRPECLRPGCSCSCGSCCPWRPKCLCKPRCLECLRPKCPECLRPSCSCSCGSCCPWRPKCFCKPRCLECVRPKCPECLRPSCSCGSCCPRRLKCFCKLKCLECLRPNCSGCSRPKCSKCCCCIQKCLPCGCFGGSCNGNDDGRQDGQS